MARKHCPSDQELLAFHVGTAPSAALEEIAEHLERCARCETALERLDSATDPVVAALRRPVSAGSALSGASSLARKVGATGSASASPAGADGITPELWPSLPGYEVLGTLGQGGMGVVYRARDLRLGRLVALKRLRSQTSQELRRSRTEAEALARVQHPNIVPIYELIEHQGQAYLTLELVEGGALSQHLSGKPQPPRQAAELIEKLARAVHHAHERGVVHRDLKPANILLQLSNGAAPTARSSHSNGPLDILDLQAAIPKITDFGIAKRLSADSGATQEGDVIGTPSYMSPEQAGGKTQEVGPATDIYSLGVILYELLTGRVPLQGPTTLDTLVLVRTADPVLPRRLQPTVPRDLETICLQCLKKEAHKRYASALDLADDLRRFLASEPIRARAPSFFYQCSKFAQRNKVLVGGVAGIVSALILGIVATSTFALREADERRRADGERQAALRQAYYAHLAAAGAAFQAHDVAAAADHLEAAPQALRDWEWLHLHSRLDESAVVMRQAERGGIHLASCPEGIRVVTTGAGGLRLVDADGRECLSMALPRYRDLLHVAHTRRRTWVFLREETIGPLAVLDETGSVRLRLELPPGRPRIIVAVSPDQTQMAAHWYDGGQPWRFAVYDLESGEKRTTFAGHAEAIFGLAYSPDGRQIASASEDRTVRLWNATTGAAVAVLRGHSDKVYSVRFSQDGSRLVSASADGTVRQWDVATRQPLSVPYRGHTHEVRTAVYSPDGRWIASGGLDRTVRLWSAADGEERAVLHGHMGTIDQCAFSPDGQRLASASHEGTVRFWDVGSGLNPSLLRGHEKYIYPVAFSPDGQWLASGSWDHKARLWDAVTGEPAAMLRHDNIVGALAFSPDGDWLVTGCRGDGMIQVWDVATAQRRRSWQGAPCSIEAMAVSPDGSRIASATEDGDVRVWEAATGRQLARWGHPDQTMHGLAYSPDGRLLAGASKDRCVYLWNAHTHQLVAKLPGHTDVVFSVSFSRDGRRLVTTSLDRTVRLWDAAGGSPLAVLHGHTEEVFSAAFHPDGRRLASAGRDSVIRLWDVTTNEEVVRLQGHTNYIYALAFSPDGSTLASGSGDFTIRLWDTAPIAGRLQARRDMEAVRAEAEQLVRRLFEEHKEPGAAIRALQTGQPVSSTLKRAVQRAIWHRLAPLE